MKSIFCFLISLTITYSFSAKAQAQDSINWLSFEDFVEFQSKQPKKVAIYLFHSECNLCGNEKKMPSGTAYLDKEGRETKPRHKVGCEWCSYMDRKVWKNQEVIDFTKDDFYVVSFDISTEDTILFRGKPSYSVQIPQKEGTKKRMITRVHQLAYGLMDGKLAFPTVIFMNEKMERAHVAHGMQTSHRFLKVLEYVKAEKYKEFKFEDFLKQLD